MPPLVSVGTESGYIFAGQISGSYAFVPEGCVHFDPQGFAQVDDLAYIRSGWDVRNMRLNTLETEGSRLFPSIKLAVTNIETPAVAAFIRHLKSVYLNR